MKKVVFIVILISSFVFNSCTSTGVFGFITTEEVLAKRMAESEQKTSAEMDRMRELLNRTAKNLSELEDSVEELNSMIKRLENMEEVAEMAKKELKKMPSEIIKEIARLLNEAVENLEKQ
ncbi:MAG: hypothetical protein JXR70_07980 [Spirochaetales bacterium]|nr:hypothetical protein [Spirochaetales bacterium]